MAISRVSIVTNGTHKRVGGGVGVVPLEAFSMRGGVNEIDSKNQSR